MGTDFGNYNRQIQSPSYIANLAYTYTVRSYDYALSIPLNKLPSPATVLHEDIQINYCLADLFP